MEVQGDIKPYINASVCDIDLNICKSKDITLKSGQTALLKIDGSFNSGIGLGKYGILRFNGNKVFDLPVAVDRPPLYKFAMPLINRGIGEGTSLIIVYVLMTISITGLIIGLRSLG